MTMTTLNTSNIGDLFQAWLNSQGIVVQLPLAEAPAKQEPVVTTTWEPTLVSDLKVGDIVRRKASAYRRIVTDVVVRRNGTILLAVEAYGQEDVDDCTALILEPTTKLLRLTTTEPKAKGSKAKSARKGRYSQPATKVQLRVVFDRAAGADYGTVAEDCKSSDGIVLARKGEPLDLVLNNLRSYNQEADEMGAPIYGFNIVGRNGQAVKAKSLAAARKASANR